MSVVINDFSATVKGITIDTDHVYWWFNSPVPGQLQVGGYSSGVLAHNSLHKLLTSPDVGVAGSCIFGNNLISWTFSLSGSGPAGTSIYFTFNAGPTAGETEGEWSAPFTSPFGMECLTLTVDGEIVVVSCSGYF